MPAVSSLQSPLGAHVGADPPVVAVPAPPPLLAGSPSQGGGELPAAPASPPAPPGEQSAMSLKYQGSFVREARECAVVEGNMVMKVGIEGRVVVGPAGGPGEVSVPLRFAVVQETPTGMRAIVTKFVIVPVTVGASGNTLFTHVEEAITFPVPTPAAQLDDYVVYVGFDPVSAEARTKAPPPKVRPKPKAKPPAAMN